MDRETFMAAAERIRVSRRARGWYEFVVVPYDDGGIATDGAVMLFSSRVEGGVGLILPDETRHRGESFYRIAAADLIGKGAKWSTRVRVSDLRASFDAAAPASAMPFEERGDCPNEECRDGRLGCPDCEGSGSRDCECDCCGDVHEVDCRTCDGSGAGALCPTCKGAEQVVVGSYEAPAGCVVLLRPSGAVELYARCRTAEGVAPELCDDGEPRPAVDDSIPLASGLLRTVIEVIEMTSTKEVEVQCCCDGMLRVQFGWETLMGMPIRRGALRAEGGARRIAGR